MIQKHHRLVTSTLGTDREVVSLHFGPAGSGRKAYIQAALHADEAPGLLVADKLRTRLSALEADGKLRCEVVLVPVANPIGLAQWIDHSHIGRFELRTAENFNRLYPDVTDVVATRIAPSLTGEAEQNVARIRPALVQALQERSSTTELESLRQTLLTLAADAEIALDLHCDCEALMHLYTATPVWDRVEPLARYLGAAASLLETESGDHPFDEACTRPWWMLQQRFPGHPIPMGCVSVTVELRGNADVDHEVAARDAEAIIHYLAQQGLVDLVPPPMPVLVAPATPLAGSEPITTPVSGVVVFRAALGARLEPGDAVADVVNPITGELVTLAAGTAGILYARENRRFAHAGMRLAKIAGATPFRTGKLLSE